MPRVPAPILSRPEVTSHILADNNDEEHKKHPPHPPHPHDHHHLGMPDWFRIAGPMPISNITGQGIEILLHQLLSSPQPHRITSNSIHNVIPEIGREPWFRFPSLRVSWPNREPLADLYYGGTGENVNAEHITTKPPEHTTITPKVTMTPPRHENNNENRPEVRPEPLIPYFRYNFLPFTHSYNPVIPKTQPMYQVVLDHYPLTL